MKSILFSLILATTLISCSDTNDNSNNINPFLIIPAVNFSLNINLPEYNDLKFPGGSVLVNSQGIKGIVVYCVNENLYTASELSDPNHLPNSCSKMVIEGIIASCPCDDGNTYDIVTGKFSPQDNSKYPMLQYRAERNGDVINVFN